LTVNERGRGKAYYLATRVKEQSFYSQLYGRIAEQTGVRRSWSGNLPVGVNVQVRTDGVSEFVFVMNFSGQTQRVSLDGPDYVDMESGQALSDAFELPVNGIRLLKRPHRA
jgi:beta-galactosidase